MRNPPLKTGLYFISLAGLLTVYFELWRAVLLTVASDHRSAVPMWTLAESFLVGLRFDFAVVSYAMIVLVLFGSIPGIDIGRNRLARRTHSLLLAATILIISAVHLVDIEFFRFFNVRLNGSAFLWNDYPAFVLPMLWKMYPVAGYLVLYVLMVTACLWLASRLRRRLLAAPGNETVLRVGLSGVALLAVFVLGARGRLEEKSPLRWGMAYFSDHDFANQLALNPAFTFFHDVLYDAGSVDRIEALIAQIEDPEAERITGDLLGMTVTRDQRIHRHVAFAPPCLDPPNIIVVIMESFGASGIGVLDNRFDVPLSPQFDSLAAQGILFTSAYSAGQHTYTGLFSTLYGYPPGFGNIVMKEVRGRNFYWGLPQILREHGYSTHFFTTSDPHFDNMQGFLMANGVEEVSSLYDYDPALKLSTLGVADHVMFDHAVEVLREHGSKPFFATLLTGSNHGPWILPDVDYGALPPGTPRRNVLNAFKYSDWSLGRFVKAVESNPALSNTVIVITADNGLLHAPTADFDLTQFHIPILILGTGQSLTPARVPDLASQVDIVATVMGLVRLNYDDYTFGRDLLRPDELRGGCALFSEWYKIGYLEEDYYAVVRLGGPTSLYNLAEPTQDAARLSPGIAATYRQRALALYQTAFHNARLPLNSPVHATVP